MKFENRLPASCSFRWGESSGVLVFDVEPKLKKACFLKLDFKIEKKLNSKIGFDHPIRLDDMNVLVCLIWM